MKPDKSVLYTVIVNRIGKINEKIISKNFTINEYGFKLKTEKLYLLELLDKGQELADERERNAK